MEIPIFCVLLHPRSRKTHKSEQIGAVVQLVRIPACHAGGRGFESRPHRKREHSSVGLEHLPYKQRVGGSTPSAPTKKRFTSVSLFFLPRATSEQIDVASMMIYCMTFCFKVGEIDLKGISRKSMCLSIDLCKSEQKVFNI